MLRRTTTSRVWSLLPGATSSSASSSSSASALLRLSSCSFSSAAADHFPGVYGTISDLHALDFRQARVGQQIESPYEVTIHPGWRDIWHSTFFQYDRLFTSRPFAQQFALKDTPLPFSLLLFQTGSMSHLDDNKSVLDLGYENAIYERPAYAEETFKKTFLIKGLRPTSDASRTVVTVQCDLYNKSSNQRVFTVDKTLVYPEAIHRHQHMKEPEQRPAAPKSLLLDHILAHSSVLQFSKSRSLQYIEPGQLLLHGLARPLGKSVNMQLSTLARLTHPLLFNMARYQPSEIPVPGALVLAMAFSSSYRSLYEILHEEIVQAAFLNMVTPKDTIGAFSFIVDVKDRRDLQEATLVTFGVKNLDVQLQLDKVKLPLELFSQQLLKPREYEELCEKHCPLLKSKLAVVAARKIYRQNPYSADTRVFLL